MARLKAHTLPSARELGSIAEEAAAVAARVLKRHFGSKLRVAEKPGAGLVTNADLAAEQAALRVLRKATPEFGILTEESAPHVNNTVRSRGRWILDPLDGTTNFVHRFPMFCISIAAEWEGRIVAGVIQAPILDETYIAIRGRGARVNGKRLRVSGTRRLQDALLTTGFAYSAGEGLRRDVELFGRLSSIARGIRRPGSAALDLAYTARGVFDGFWERNLSAWDVAAGSLLVEEAGGKVSDFQGNPFTLDSREILAANQPLFRPFVEALSG